MDDLEFVAIVFICLLYLLLLFLECYLLDVSATGTDQLEPDPYPESEPALLDLADFRQRA